MAKFNLSEAAADILNGNVASKRAGQDGSKKLDTSVVDGQKDAGKIGDAPEKTMGDNIPDYTKGSPTATPPGATPPVGKQTDGVGASKPQGQPAEQGSANAVAQADPTSYEAIRDRIKAKLAQQTFDKNPGAVWHTAEEVSSEEEVVAEEKEGHEDAAEDKAMIKKALNKAKMKEDIDALLSGQDLSEEFVQRATTIFEAAVVSRVAEIAEDVENQLVEEFASAMEQMKEDYATKVDDYLNYMVEEWMTENKLAIESGLRAEVVEGFIGGLRDLFAEHYIDIPEEKVDVVEEMASKVEDLEAKLNEEISRNIEMKKQINEQVKIQAIHAACEGLTQTQVEKIKSLAEGVDFTTVDEFAGKLATLVEAYAPSTIKSADKSALEEAILVEEEDKQISQSSDPFVNAIARSISKSVVK